ncbi:MAG: hypothetical protein ACYTBZ_04965 [Planctomycetota bacterium]
MIDFETFPDGTIVPARAEITNQYASIGITFDSVYETGSTQITTIVAYLPTPSGTNCLMPNGPAPSLGGTLILEFSIPVIYIEAIFVDDNKPVQITSYDASWNVLKTTSSDGIANSLDLVGLSDEQSGISYVHMEGKTLDYGLPDGWGIDNLSFTPIPEPATALFFALGCLGLIKRKC